MNGSESNAMRITEERMAATMRITKIESAIAHAILEVFEEEDELTDEEILAGLCAQTASRMRRLANSQTKATED